MHTGTLQFMHSRRHPFHATHENKLTQPNWNKIMTIVCTICILLLNNIYAKRKQYKDCNFQWKSHYQNLHPPRKILSSSLSISLMANLPSVLQTGFHLNMVTISERWKSLYLLTKGHYGHNIRTSIWHVS